MRWLVSNQTLLRLRKKIIFLRSHRCSSFENCSKPDSRVSEKRNSALETVWPFPDVSWTRDDSDRVTSAADASDSMAVCTVRTARQYSCFSRNFNGLYFYISSDYRKKYMTAKWDHSAHSIKVSIRSRCFQRGEASAQISMGKCNKKKKERRRKNKTCAITVQSVRVRYPTQTQLKLMYHLDV